MALVIYIFSSFWDKFRSSVIKSVSSFQNHILDFYFYRGILLLHLFCKRYWEPCSSKMVAVRVYKAKHPLDWKFCNMLSLHICCMQILPLMLINFIDLHAGFAQMFRSSLQSTLKLEFMEAYFLWIWQIPTLCCHIYFLTLVWSWFPIYHKLFHPNSCSYSQSWFLVLRTVTEESAGSPDGFSLAKKNNFSKNPFLTRQKYSFYFLNVSGWHSPGPEEMYHKTPVPLTHKDRGINLCLCSLCSIKNLGKPDWQFRCQITKFPIYIHTRFSYRSTLVHCSKRWHQKIQTFLCFAA